MPFLAQLKVGGNIYDVARNEKGLGNDCNTHMDTLKNVSHGFKDGLDKTALKHINSIEQNLLYLKMKSLENRIFGQANNN